MPQDHHYAGRAETSQQDPDKHHRAADAPSAPESTRQAAIDGRPRVGRAVRALPQLRPTRRRPAHADPSGGGRPPPPAAEHNSPLISLVRTIPNGRVPFGDSTSFAAPPLVGGGVAKRASGQWIIRSWKQASRRWSETRLSPGAGRARWRAEPPACLAQSPSYLNETSTRTRYVVTLPSSIVTSKR